MIRSHFRSSSGEVRTNLGPNEFAAALQDRQGTLWIDIIPRDERTQELAALLEGLFHFHPLAIDDALHEVHVPRLDDWQQYLYVVLQALVLDDGHEIATRELDAFLGPNYLVTIHADDLPALDHLWRQCEKGMERRLASGPDHVLYVLLDGIVSDYMKVVEALDDVIDELETKIFRQPHPSLVNRIFRLRRTLLKLRRMLGALREVLNKLARDDYAVIDAADRVYFRDVYDHLVRLYDIVEGLRDVIGGALDSYLSITSNRINEVMRTLTVVTVLFAPLSFLTGFFGMNFFGEAFNVENPTASALVFAGCLAVMLGTPTVMFWWMFTRGWLRPAAPPDAEEAETGAGPR